MKWSEQKRWTWQALIPVLAGMLFWIQIQGPLGFFLGVLPGALLLSTGVAFFLWPGDHRIPQFMGLGAIAGILFGLPGIILLDFWISLGALLLSLASWFVAGWIGIRQAENPPGVPEPEPELSTYGNSTFDEAILGAMQVCIPLPRGEEWDRISDEVDRARELFREKGWLDDLSLYHPVPPVLKNPKVVSRRIRGISFEHLSFESGYEPHREEPGRDRWMALSQNRTAHAWLVRSGRPEAPWILCEHGYQMGTPFVDLHAFRAKRLVKELGFNLIIPVLPLHGPRKEGRISGDGFLSGDVLDTIHAEAQAIWDLRRILSWLNAEGASGVYLYGLSLGGYTVSLLSGLDSSIRSVVAGIPVVDFAGVLSAHAPAMLLKMQAESGLTLEKIRETYQVISPLHLDSQVAMERRFIFGGIADRMAFPDQVYSLWKHWNEPRICWYPGGHFSFFWNAEATAYLEEIFQCWKTDSGN